MGELKFSMADLYPGMAGFYGTRQTTIPEAADQSALVDNEEAAKENSVHTTPSQHRNILIGIIVAVVVLVLLGR
jgi:capsular polysaccharide biosynthesis protein